MADAFHIASLVVHAQPEAAMAAAAAIAAMPGAEVPFRDGTRLVVTLETADEAEILDNLTRIQLLDGVLSAALVYHHAEPSPDLQGDPA